MPSALINHLAGTSSCPLASGSLDLESLGKRALYRASITRTNASSTPNGTIDPLRLSKPAVAETTSSRIPVEF